MQAVRHCDGDHLLEVVRDGPRGQHRRAPRGGRCHRDPDSSVGSPGCPPVRNDSRKAMRKKVPPMSDYLPDVYVQFRDRYPDVVRALDELGRATEAAGGLDARTQRLVKLGIAIGALAEGAVRSNVRKARSVGVPDDEIRQTRCSPSPRQASRPWLPLPHGSMRFSPPIKTARAGLPAVRRSRQTGGAPRMASLGASALWRRRG